MGAAEDPRAAFGVELARPDAKIDLARAALLIAAEEYPGLDVEAYLGRIDRIADGVRPRLSADEGPASVLAAINGHIYGELGFRGNREDYYDPRNSFLNDVIERRTGLPILLSILYREVAARLGHELVGINLPLHFVLAWPLPDGPLIVDAFEEGAILTPAQCERRLARIYGQSVSLGPDVYQPVGARMIVRRLLNNLLNEYERREDFARALAAVERMAMALPAIEDWRTRGLLLLRLGKHRQAEEELAAYLANAPDQRDRAEIERQLRWIRRLRASAN